MKNIRIFAIALLMAAGLTAFGQNTTGTGTNTGTTSPFHKVELTVTIPSSMDPGTIVHIGADWTVEYTTPIQPDKSKSFTVVKGTDTYPVDFNCPIDARPSKIYLCGSTTNVFPIKYFSKETLINQSSSITYITVTASEWNTTGCAQAGTPGGGGTD